MIASSINGRLRIRDNALRDPSTTEILEKRLSAMKGVLEVKINRRVGSLLIIYNEAVTDVKVVSEALAGYSGMTRPGAGNPVIKKGKEKAALTRITKRISKRGMLASLAMSVIAAILGAEGLHVVFGALFLVFFAMHFSRHREMVFA